MMILVLQDASSSGGKNIDFENKVQALLKNDNFLNNQKYILGFKEKTNLHISYITKTNTITSKYLKHGSTGDEFHWLAVYTLSLLKRNHYWNYALLAGINVLCIYLFTLTYESGGPMLLVGAGIIDYYFYWLCKESYFSIKINPQLKKGGELYAISDIEL